MKSSTRHSFSPSTSGLTSFEVRDAMEITYGGSTVGWRALISAESGCFNVSHSEPGRDVHAGYDL